MMRPSTCLWKDALTSEDGAALPKVLYPKLSISYDMAWQQRNLGHKYASPSGHALLVGRKCRKLIKSKLCNICSSYRKKNPDMEEDDEVPPHECTKNHVGSSASMEAVGCLEMVQLVFEKWNCIIDSICIDDDASTRSLVKWSNEDHMMNNHTTIIPQVPISKGPNKGKLQTRQT